MMYTGISRAVLAGGIPLDEKSKISTTAAACISAAEAAMENGSYEPREEMGIIGAYSQGPADIYAFNYGKLYSRGVRGLRPQKAIHSILCEPACQTGIELGMKGFNMSVIGDELCGIQAMAAAADAVAAGMAGRVLILGGDVENGAADGGAAVMSSAADEFILRAVRTMFCGDRTERQRLLKKTSEYLLDCADADAAPLVITDKEDICADENISPLSGGAGAFRALSAAQEKAEKLKRPVMFLSASDRGTVGGFIIEAGVNKNVY